MALIVLPVPSMSHEDLYGAMARQDYVAGRIELEQFEKEIAEILAGGLPDRLFGGLPPPNPMRTERR